VLGTDQLWAVLGTNLVDTGVRIAFSFTSSTEVAYVTQINPTATAVVNNLSYTDTSTTLSLIGYLQFTSFVFTLSGGQVTCVSVQGSTTTTNIIIPASDL
jgi:hypothetical protein